MRYLFILIFLFVSLDNLSQDRSQWSRGAAGQNFQMPNMIVKGKLVDSESNDGLSYATISIVTLDSILISGGITDDNGKFKIEINPRKMMEKIREERKANSRGTGMGLIAEITYVGYKIKKVSIPFTRENREVDLKNIILESDATALSEVTVRAEKSSLELKLDKRVFNVGKDLSNKGGTAEEILENIPSIDLDIEGNISLRGSQSVRILIDGKPASMMGFDGPNAFKQLQGNEIDKVEIITSKPNPILLNQLSNIFIMSKAWSEKNFAMSPQNWDAGQETFSATNALGTGPFKITLREPNTKTVFKRNKHWWGEMKDKSVTQIELMPIKNAATRVAALLSGEIDLVTDAPVQDLKRIGSSSGHKVESTAQMRTIFLGMDQAADKLRTGNTGDNPFKKKEVRQALYQAIDIEAIKKKVMRGLSEPAGIITFPGVNGYTADLDKRLPYDVNAAKKLLADAGYPNGFDVELRCPNDRYVNDEAICTAVVGMLGKIGVNVNLFAQTKSKHFKELKDDQGDFYMLGWGVPTLDSHYVFHYLYETGASWNKVNFSNADVDAAIRVMEGEVDLDKRNAAIAKAWKIVKDDISYLPLHHQVISWASKSNVNVPIRPNNEPLFRTASFN